MSTNHVYRIVLADDYAPVRGRVRKVIEEDPCLEVVGEAGDGLELLEILKTIRPDLVILDISMPRLGGLQAAKRIKELYPEVKLMILSMNRNKLYLRHAVATGASSYVLKDDMDAALSAAIQEVRHGRHFFSRLGAE